MRARSRRRLAVLNEIFTDVNSTRKSQGIFSAWVHLLKIIRSRIFLRRGAILFARSLEGALPDVQMDEGLTVREMTVNDLHLVALTDKSSSESCKILLESGATGLIALKDSQLVAYVWFAPEVDLHLHQLYLPLAQGEVYSFNNFTLPAFRRQGIQSVLHQRMFQLLREKGYRRVLVLVGLDNPPSLQMISGLYKVIGYLMRIKIFRLMYFRYEPQILGEARHIIKWLGI